MQVSGAHLVCMSVLVSPQAVAGQEGDDLLGRDEAVLCGHLKNSESLQNLDGLLCHLDVLRLGQLADLIRKYPGLFRDTPIRMHLVKQDIDIGDCIPIKQWFYRVHPERKYLDAKEKYMLDKGIAQLTSSSCSTAWLVHS